MTEETRSEAGTRPAMQTPVERLISGRREFGPPAGVAGGYPVVRPVRNRKRLLFFSGVALPAATIVIELLLGACKAMFFDPLPTGYHIALVCLTPLANWLVWRELYGDEVEARWYLGIASGMAIGVSLIYTIVSLPLLPMSIFASILGIGLLGLAPLLSLISGIAMAIRLGHRLREEVPSAAGWFFPLRGLGCGFVCSVAILVTAQYPSTMARVALHRAVSDAAETRIKGIDWLREHGQEEVVLRASKAGGFAMGGTVGPVLDLFYPVRPRQAREVYYRMTGQTVESVPLRERSRLLIDEELVISDGNPESSVMPGLSLFSSSMDGSIDGHAALGYLEWTMVFKNSGFGQAEARSEVELPPGGVVSRLTLWVNGEEREAAFAAQRKVEAAYNSVVMLRKDPVLVTSSGVDRINIRCFPVPADGEMKIRLGITAPLHMRSADAAVLRLPRFVERNFRIDDATGHAVWIEGKQSLSASSKALVAERPGAELFAVRGSLPESELAGSFPAVRASRTASESWTEDQKDGRIIRQRFEEIGSERAGRMILVFDGSAGMRAFAGPTAGQIEKHGSGRELLVVIASDSEVDEVVELARSDAAEIARKLREFEFRGGQDNLPALERAWDLAAEKPGSVIVWVHEPQTLLLSSADRLLQRIRRRPDGPLLIDLQTNPGANLIAGSFVRTQNYENALRLGRLEDDLESILATGGNSRYRAIRESSADDVKATAGRRTSSHLARLWAFDEVRRLLATDRAADLESALKIATEYQLVTPVSGAVVLETDAQYEAADLRPVDRGTVPTIPEPEEWLLLIVVSIVLAWTLLQRRRLWRTS